MDDCQQEIKKFSQFLFSIPPAELSLLGAIIGIMISVPLNLSEQRTIGNFIQLVSQSVLTYSAQEQGIMDLQTPSVACLAKQIEELKKASRY